MLGETEKNRKFYESNPRLSMIARNLDKMDIKRKENIFQKADNFININTLWKIPKFVRLVENLSLGEKNGKEIGQTLFTVEKDAERINYKQALNSIFLLFEIKNPLSLLLNKSASDGLTQPGWRATS